MPSIMCRTPVADQDIVVPTLFQLQHVSNSNLITAAQAPLVARATESATGGLIRHAARRMHELAQPRRLIMELPPAGGGIEPATSGFCARRGLGCSVS